MSEQAADPVTSEDEFYAAIVSEYAGLRRAGAGLVAAAVLTSAHMVMIQKAAEA